MPQLGERRQLAVDCNIADAPAMCVKTHTEYYSYKRCIASGMYQNGKVDFPTHKNECTNGLQFPS